MSGDQKVMSRGSQPVIEIVRADVPEGRLMDYAMRNRALCQHLKGLVPDAKARFWVTFVGTKRSNVLNVIEHPNLAAYAENMATIEADPEVRKMGAEVASSGRIVLGVVVGKRRRVSILFCSCWTMGGVLLLQFVSVGWLGGYFTALVGELFFVWEPGR